MLIMARQDGAVLCAPGNSRRWLAYFLGNGAAARLPRALMERLAQTALHRQLEPISVQRSRTKLLIAPASPAVQGCICLLLKVRRVTAEPAPVAPSTLTRREAEVLAMLRDGRSDQEIGRLLKISRRTASKHVQSILVKLGVRNRTAAVSVVAAGRGAVPFVPVEAQTRERRSPTVLPRLAAA